MATRPGSSPGSTAFGSWNTRTTRSDIPDRRMIALQVHGGGDHLPRVCSLPRHSRQTTLNRSFSVFAITGLCSGGLGLRRSAGLFFFRNQGPCGSKVGRVGLVGERGQRVVQQFRSCLMTSRAF